MLVCPRDGARVIEIWKRRQGLPMPIGGHPMQLFGYECSTGHTFNLGEHPVESSEGEE